MLEEDHRRAYRREAVRKKRAMDNEEGRAYKKQRQEELGELRKQTLEMIKQLPLHSSSYSTTVARVVITGLEKLATLKKKRQFEDKKIVQNVINQFDGTESDYKEDINIYDKEAAELIQGLGMDIDDDELFNAEEFVDI